MDRNRTKKKRLKVPEIWKYLKPKPISEFVLNDKPELNRNFRKPFFMYKYVRD